AEIDEFVAEPPASAVRVRLRVRGEGRHAPFAAPWLVSLSAWDGSLAAPSGARSASATRLAVPALSQMEADAVIRMRICSPASVAMVLAYWGERVEVASLAREIFHPALDRYGVWPAAISAAGRHGVAGYLLRFPDWAWATCSSGRPRLSSPEARGLDRVSSSWRSTPLAWAMGTAPSSGPDCTRVAVQCGQNGAPRDDPDRSGVGGGGRGLRERRRARMDENRREVHDGRVPPRLRRVLQGQQPRRGVYEAPRLGRGDGHEAGAQAVNRSPQARRRS